MDTRNEQLRPKESLSRTERLSYWSQRLWNWANTIFFSLLLIIGWRGRDESYLNAADGWGYALGIIGGSVMLFLLFYPLRKSIKAMRNLVSVKRWFQLHMALGVIGPVLILFHSNFSLGSTNSNLALFSMLLVAGSGLVGRFFYTRIHYGLYGQMASLKDLRHDIQLTKGNLGAHISLSPRIIKKIKRYEKFMLKPRFFLLHLLFMPLIAVRSKLTIKHITWSLLTDLKKQAYANNWGNEMLNDFKKQSKEYLRDYFFCLKKTSQLTVYARLFSFWHVFHLPLFIMLVVTGIVHVIAVHMY